MSSGLETTIIASATALIAAGITYISTNRRDQLQARIEICKYKEKWLAELRAEMIKISALYISRLDMEVQQNDHEKFIEHLTRISLLVNSSNSHWGDMKECMRLMNKNFGGNYDDGPKVDLGKFQSTCEKILKEEWDEIQGLLHKTQKKKI